MLLHLAHALENMENKRKHERSKNWEIRNGFGILLNGFKDDLIRCTLLSVEN